MSDDDDKTVFGQKLPDAAPSGKSAPVPPASPPPTVAPVAAPSPGADKTVFGAQLPPAQPPGYVPPAQPGAGRAAPTGGPPPNHEDTWVGGALNPFDAPRPQQGQTPPAYGQQPLYQPQHVPTGADMFPDVQREAPQQAPLQTPRIALDDALKAAGPNTGASSNPLIAAASNLMILLGRLRTGMVELQSGPLIDHVTREIDQYERNLLTAGVAAQDAQDAKYALAASADDIVQNLPGADRGTWMQYAMVPRFFGERDSGIGFFRKMDQAMQAPAQRYNLLELMLTCMSLGFEGQYRTSTNGAVELARVRSAVYETLRRVQPRPDDDISIAWTAVPLGIRRRYGGTPTWAVAAVGALMVLALFATLSTLIARQGGVVQDRILAMHEGLPKIAIERAAPITEAAYTAAESTQLGRIRDALANRIDLGEVAVEQTSEFILVRVGQVLQFDSGRATLSNDFAALAEDIAGALEPESGPIRIIGYTDNVPSSGRGQYKTNEELSLARAQTVAGIISPMLTDASRIETEGLGPVNPVASNDTAEGQALNRRVEIMIQREATP